MKRHTEPFQRDSDFFKLVLDEIWNVAGSKIANRFFCLTYNNNITHMGLRLLSWTKCSYFHHPAHENGAYLLHEINLNMVKIAVTAKLYTYFPLVWFNLYKKN